MKYRAEIDGLRALAVVPVILFHAGFDWFSGGFVGVDVFFVISGYLITTILIEEIENKRFSIANFYERRARRILPALFFVMLVCIPFAWMWILPRDLLDFSQSLAATLSFSSNILFWKESNYFGTEAELKPLLHTWSLAVEEQYYVLFPVLLLLAWRYGKNRVFWIIIVFAVLSLLLSEWEWRNKASTANFYLAPTRAWELFSGSIAAFIVQKRGVQKNEVLSLLGIVAILFAIFVYDETTPFPSVYALVPVLGVVLLMLFADKKTIAAKILSSKLLVGIGLISYSAYLWHQPILALFNYKFQHSSLIVALLLIVVLILSYVTWKYVESPFRHRDVITRKTLLGVCVFGYVIIGSVGVLGALNVGNVLALVQPDPFFGVFERKVVNNPHQYGKDHSKDIIIWGDSFADALAFPMSDVLKNSDIGIISHIRHSCPSLMGTLRNEPKRLGQGFGKSCQEHNDQVIHSLSKTKLEGRYLVIASAYYWYSTGKNMDDKPILMGVDGEKGGINAVEEGLINTIHWAEENQLIPIVVLAPPFFENFEKTLRKDVAEARNTSVESKGFREVNDALKKSLAHTSALVVDPVSIFCGKEEGLCNAYDSKGKRFIVWYDGSHLSEYGGHIIAKEIVNLTKTLTLQ